MKEETQFSRLFQKYIAGTANEEEIKLFFLMVNQDDRLDELNSLVDKEILTPEDAPVLALHEKQEIIKNIFAQSEEYIKIPKERNTVNLWLRITAAASIVLLLSFGSYFLIHKNPIAKVAKNKVYDVAPGRNQATLILANGQKIILTKGLRGQLATQGNAIVKADNAITYTASRSSSTDIQYNTMSTVRGEQSPYPLILADGTKVWLNAASSITFPTAFNGKKRMVKITGEAYFEVAHNAAKPFVVTLPNQTVEVLGTHFDINAYTDESAVKTTLLEGSVKVYNDKSARVIKPGQQAILQNNELSVANVNTEEAIAWKEGYFRFDNERIESIMRKLARWYDIDVQYAGTVPDDEFTGVASRSRNISDVLKKLEYYNTVHFKIQGRRVTVLK